MRGAEQEVLRGISRLRCTERCLDERRFICRYSLELHPLHYYYSNLSIPFYFDQVRHRMTQTDVNVI